MESRGWIRYEVGGVDSSVMPSRTLAIFPSCPSTILGVIFPRKRRGYILPWGSKKNFSAWNALSGEEASQKTLSRNVSWDSSWTPLWLVITVAWLACTSLEMWPLGSQQQLFTVFFSWLPNLYLHFDVSIYRKDDLRIPWDEGWMCLVNGVHSVLVEFVSWGWKRLYKFELSEMQS